MIKEYPLVKGKDPRNPMEDPQQEQFLHTLINNGGNKAKAYNAVYYKGKGIPANRANYPYLLMSRKLIQARYDYLLDQKLEECGLDNRNLLHKAATLINSAVSKKDINGFATMVNVVQKLKGEDVVKIASIQRTSGISKEDQGKVDTLFETLTK